MMIRCKNKAVRLPRQLLSLSKQMAMLVVVALSMAFAAVAQAAPSSPTDETKVPHYFGPYPNWANSPLRVADASVTITDPGGGTGAKASPPSTSNRSDHRADVTAPGSGYTAGTTTVAINLGSTGQPATNPATATATVQAGAAVTGITVGSNPAQAPVTSSRRSRSPRPRAARAPRPMRSAAWNRSALP